MRSCTALAVVVCACVAATAAHAGDLAFIDASSELDDGKPATDRYNVVDGNPSTVWCTKPDVRAQRGMLSLGFDDDTLVTHIGLIVGARAGDTLDRSRKRARTIAIADGKQRIEATFRDVPELQLVELKTPMSARRIAVEVVTTYEGASSGAPLCLSELVLRSRGKELTGERVALRYRALTGPEKAFLREWIDDVSAPQRRLLFALDKTFQYAYEPILESGGARLRGTWSADRRSVTLDIGGKNYRVAARRSMVDDGERRTVELVLDGDSPHASMISTFRPAPARHP